MAAAEKKNLKPAEIVGALVIVAVMIWWLSSDSDDKKTEPAQVKVETNQAKPSLPKVQQIPPETVVRFSQGTYACLNQDDLRAIIEHAMKGEKTKANALDVSRGGGCVFVPPNKMVRVISTKYDNDQAEIGLLEVIGETNQSGKGAWAFSIGAEPVK